MQTVGVLPRTDTTNIYLTPRATSNCTYISSCVDGSDSNLLFSAAHVEDFLTMCLRVHPYVYMFWKGVLKRGRVDKETDKEEDREE